jgi:hypothetical protein
MHLGKKLTISITVTILLAFAAYQILLRANTVGLTSAKILLLVTAGILGLQLLFSLNETINAIQASKYLKAIPWMIYIGLLVSVGLASLYACSILAFT